MSDTLKIIIIAAFVVAAFWVMFLPDINIFPRAARKEAVHVTRTGWKTRPVRYKAGNLLLAVGGVVAALLIIIYMLLPAIGDAVQAIR